MDSVLAFLVNHGGWGSIFAIISTTAAYVFYKRNNDLQDERAELRNEIARLRLRLDDAVTQAAKDRETIINTLKEK